MIVDLAALRLGKTPLLVKRSFSKDDFRLKDETVELAGPVHVDLRVEVVDERVRVAGNLSASLILTCCRCACSFNWKADKAFAVEYWPDRTEDEGEIELGYDDLNVGFYSGDHFDLKEAILEQVLIDISMNPVCKEDCRGLCEKCGADLNQEQCSCGKDEVDPRFEALKAIKDRAN